MLRIMQHLPIIILFLEVIATQEVPTPSSLLGPRNFNHHAFEAKEYSKKLLEPVPTRKGPVLFPNDAPPPPPTPLIVTSRPLQESIARSDLNGNLSSNTITDQSQINTVTFKPRYFGRITQYKPMPLSFPPLQDIGQNGNFNISPASGPNVIDDTYSYVPYTDIVKKSVTNEFDVGDRFSNYEDNSALPPIYNALSQHAEQNLFKTQQSPAVLDYQPKQQINEYDNHGHPNDGTNTDNAQDKGYAFSYTVRDQKTGDDFSHSQSSSGSATNGEYRVRLPDGRMQIVSYTADENGYKADVKYDVDGTGKSVEYNIANTKQNEHKLYNYNDDPIKLNAQRYNVNNKFHNDYNSPTHNNNDNFHSNINSPTKSESYPELSKEYYNDYSIESANRYDPYQSKFSALYQDNKANAINDYDFKTNLNNDYVTSTPKPNYLEIRDVLTKALPNVQPTFNSYPSYTVHDTTDNVVLIGGQNGFTSPKTPSVDDFNNFVASTPRSYLVSTISSLRDRVSSKPLLSDSFIHRINKYLSFK